MTTQFAPRRGLGDRFPLVVAAVEALAARACTIDGEVIACDGDGLADFELLGYRQRDDPVTLVAFDLIELTAQEQFTWLYFVGVAARALHGNGHSI